MRFFNRILHRLIPPVFFYIENSASVFLTIDDSPSEHTVEILDILDSYQVKASFFCIGKNIVEFPSQFNEIVKRGHTIGYHSFEHKNAWEKANFSFDFISDFEKNKAQYNSKIYRPPYGKLTWELYRHISNQNKIFLWDILTEDWKQGIDPLKKIMSKIKGLNAGSIIVFHDNKKAYENCKIMLPCFLEYCQQNDLKIEVLSNG
jgi:peptidoglycan-N-acetylglucosamine deacetylase